MDCGSAACRNYRVCASGVYLFFGCVSGVYVMYVVVFVEMGVCLIWGACVSGVHTYMYMPYCSFLTTHNCMFLGFFQFINDNSRCKPHKGVYETACWRP